MVVEPEEEGPVMQEEIFGPLMAVQGFETEEEALARANALPYGLSAGLCTQNLQRAQRVARNLEAGIVWVNNYNVTPIEMPFGPIKQSGYGKENGLEALEQYTQLKSVYLELSEAESPF